MSDDITVTVTRTADALAEARRIRHEVFIEEQGIPAHLDPDGLDDAAFHALCRVGGEVAATGRLVIGEGGTGTLARIAVRVPFRGRGLGRRIVMALHAVAEERGVATLTLQPHRHLEAFYESLGYGTIPGTDVVGHHELITMRRHLRARNATP